MALLLLALNSGCPTAPAKPVFGAGLDGSPTTADFFTGVVGLLFCSIAVLAALFYAFIFLTLGVDVFWGAVLLSTLVLSVTTMVSTSIVLAFVLAFTLLVGFAFLTRG